MEHMPPEVKVDKEDRPYEKDRHFSTENLNIFQKDVIIVVYQGCISKTKDVGHITRDVITVTGDIN